MADLQAQAIVGKHGYGWLPDRPDQRDQLYAPGGPILRKLAETPKFDLSVDAAMPSIWNQDTLGSCQGHATGRCFAFAHGKAEAEPFMPSRLWIYFQSRVLEGTPDYDAGSYIRDGFRVCAKLGVPPEEFWPYDIPTFAGPAPKAATEAASAHQAIVYRRVPQTLTSLKASILGGQPFAFGFTVFESFESGQVAKDGMVPLPGLDESELGGHAVTGVGYDDSEQRFKVANSWTEEWGDGGYCYMPYSFLTDQQLCADFWQVSLVT